MIKKHESYIICHAYKLLISSFSSFIYQKNEYISREKNEIVYKSESLRPL